MKYINFLLLSSLLMLNACVKDKFDEPPANGTDPNITVNKTIAELKAWYDSTNPKLIEQDWVIAGVVVADDKSGNFYKTLVIQDATAGIALRIDQSSMYTTMPVGRRIFIKLKGLYLGQYSNLVQIGFNIDPEDPSSVTEIPSALVNNYILRGQWNVAAEPLAVSIAELNAAVGGDYLRWPYQNMLIQLNDVQFDKLDTAKTYADAITKASLNRIIKDCSGFSVTLRSSGYSSFASELTPTGRGKITAVASVYGTTLQLYIRDLNDVKIDSPRCGVGSGGPLTSFIETFDAVTVNAEVDVPGWQSIVTDGPEPWEGRSYSGNFYAQASAYNIGSSMEAWLISPPVNFDVASKLEFEAAKAFWAHANAMSVYYSTNFTGNPQTATWTQITCTLPQQADANYAFIPSGIIDLSAATGTGHIAFVYTGNSNGQTTTIQLDNIKVY